VWLTPAIPVEKFTASVIDTGGKFATVSAGGAMLLIPVVHLDL
jgi:hypothetical protein